LTRKVVFFTSGLSMIFMAVILLIHAQPYQDGGLRAFLVPPSDCSAPCWLGIRPGVTTISGSSGILEGSSWIGAFEPISPATAFVKFSEAISAVKRGRVNLWEGREGVVERLALFDTGLSLSDVQLVLGRPERLFLKLTVQHGTSHLVAIYPQYDLTVIAAIDPCAVHQQTFWNEADDLELTVGSWEKYLNDPQPDYYVSSFELDPQRWTTQIRQVRLCFP
jgi:hypothetical protein